MGADARSIGPQRLAEPPISRSAAIFQYAAREAVRSSGRWSEVGDGMNIEGIGAIVTGGGSGLGEATARALAADKRPPWVPAPVIWATTCCCSPT